MRVSVILAGGLAVCLIVLLPLAISPVPSLFIVTAETSRVQYTIRSAIAADQARLYVRGARVRVGPNLLHAKLNAPPQPDPILEPGQAAAEKPPAKPDPCYEGFVDLRNGTTVEFGVFGGQQQLSLSGPEGHAMARLSQDVVRLSFDGSDAKPSPLQLGHFTPSPGYFVLKEGSTLLIDPSCADENVSVTELGFGHKSEPLLIDGPGQIGRGIRVEGDDIRRVERFATYVTGSIEVLVRSGLCRKPLGLSCNRLFHANSNPVPIPAGAAIEGGSVRPNWLFNDVGQAHFNGYAYYDGGTYHVNMSSEGMNMLLLLPSPAKNDPSRDRVSVSILERLSVEPVMTGLFSALIGLIGLIIGLAQITPPADGPTRAQTQIGKARRRLLRKVKAKAKPAPDQG